MAKALEIEKKYTLKGIPEGIEPIRVEEIEQIYIRIEECVEERVRKKTNKKTRDVKYIHTIKKDKKGKEALIREETEKEITPEEYELLRKQGIRGLKKERNLYKNKKGEEVSIDIYPEGMYLLEIEYPSVEEIGKEQDILEGIEILREVTHDGAYKNQNLAKKLRC